MGMEKPLSSPGYTCVDPGPFLPGIQTPKLQWGKNRIASNWSNYGRICSRFDIIHERDRHRSITARQHRPRDGSLPWLDCCRAANNVFSRKYHNFRLRWSDVHVVLTGRIAYSNAMLKLRLSVSKIRQLGLITVSIFIFFLIKLHVVTAKLFGIISCKFLFKPLTTCQTKLYVLNNRLLRIVQKKSIKHIMIYIKVTLFFLYSYFINLIFYYLCLIMFTIGINYQWYFPRILRKIK